eukprot:GHVH01003843.1.p1 GENE.GHVH01003843.1~~GHVH01003843.1.p1  ORF type:complete len:353 (+),score=45.25 GHVH01003843.1:94-1152(+)
MLSHWSVDEIPPIRYEFSNMMESIVQYRSVFISPSDAKVVLPRVEAEFKLDKHIKRVLKIEVAGERATLQVLLFPASQSVDIPVDLCQFPSTDEWVPSSPPLNKRQFDSWTGWPLKWLQPPWKSSKLDCSDEKLSVIYNTLVDIEHEQAAGHPCVNSCFFLGEDFMELASNRSMIDSPESVMSPRMFPAVADHAVMIAIRKLAHEVRRAEVVARDDDFDALQTLPGNRERVKRLASSERNAVKKKMKIIEDVALCKEYRFGDGGVCVNSTQYYASGLTVAILGENICLMCAMALIHSRVSRLLIYNKNRASSTSIDLFRSNLVRMHADGQRLNHTFTAYCVQPNNQVVSQSL